MPSTLMHGPPIVSAPDSPVNAKLSAGGSSDAAASFTGPVKRRDVLAARNGFTSQARAAAWMWLAHVEDKRTAASQTFHQLACCDHVPDDVLYAIEEDCRKMPSTLDHSLFTTTRGSDALSRLLMAFYQRNPSVGYIRGHTARLAAVVLVAHGARNLENAFWNFCALMEDRLFFACGGQVTLGVRMEQRVFERLVAKKLPAVTDHLAKLGLPLSSLTNAWFSSCFTSVLPAEAAARVLDSVMAEGVKVVHRVALALLKRHSAAIDSCARGDCLLKVLEGRMARGTDAEELIQMAFHSVGSFPSALLKSFRDIERPLMAAELAKEGKGGVDIAAFNWSASAAANHHHHHNHLSSSGNSSRSLASARSMSSSGRSDA